MTDGLASNVGSLYDRLIKACAAEAPVAENASLANWVQASRELAEALLAIAILWPRATAASLPNYGRSCGMSGAAITRLAQSAARLRRARAWGVP